MITRKEIMWRGEAQRRLVRKVKARHEKEKLGFVADAPVYPAIRCRRRSAPSSDRGSSI